MPTVGFSTGALALGDFESALKMLVTKRAEAVELSALRFRELPRMVEAVSSLLGELRERYAYIAFHAPTDYDDEERTVELLLILAHQGHHIVAHPDKIRDFSLWRRLGSCLCIENMDTRKRLGRTAHELADIFELLPEARLCFDMAHARQVDPTMTEAVRILKRFRNRLAHVHLSEVNGSGRHFPMSYVAKLSYRVLADYLSGVPIILESPVAEACIDEEISEAERVLTRSQKSRLPEEHKALLQAVCP